MVSFCIKIYWFYSFICEGSASGLDDFYVYNTDSSICDLSCMGNDFYTAFTH